MLHFIEKGNGKEIIVLLHGNSSSCNAWEKVMSATCLSAYTVLAPDLPGHGQSLRLQDSNGYSVAENCKYLLEFLHNTCEERNYVIVGNSLASVFIGELAPRLKGCRGVLVTGSCMVGQGIGPEQIFQQNPNSAVVFSADPPREQVRLLIKDSVALADDTLMDSVLADFFNTDPVYRNAVAGMLAPGQLTDEFRNIAEAGLPLAVVFGKDEKTCDPHHLDSKSQNFWRQKVFLIDGARHLTHLDRPEETAKLICEFAKDCFAS